MVQLSVAGREWQAKTVSRIFLFSFACCIIACVAGTLGALTYTKSFQAVYDMGLTFQHLRPLHTSFATAWLFLAAIGIMYSHLFSAHGEPSQAVKTRCALHMGLWVLAALGILVSVCVGVFSGREYVGFHPVFSIPIILGWLLFVWNWFSVSGFVFRGRPVYIYMWNVGVLFFIFTFCEAHAYLLDFLRNRPVQDMAVQWKSYGTMVGAMNMLAYGSAMYVGEKVSGDTDYAHSRMAFSLYFIGTLNSFTNYAHHTYHLPHSHWVKIISFSISMLEVLILVKVIWDILKMVRRRAERRSYLLPAVLLTGVTVWTLFQLTLSVIISVPPINALIHGTHIVPAHGMGSMLGIDTMILWAGVAYVLHQLLPVDHRVLTSRTVKLSLIAANGFMFVLWASLVINGLVQGFSRHLGPDMPATPTWDRMFPSLFAHSGAALTICIVIIMGCWAVALIRRKTLAAEV
jgi:nitric oxide reductase subunit B